MTGINYFHRQYVYGVNSFQWQKSRNKIPLRKHASFLQCFFSLMFFFLNVSPLYHCVIWKCSRSYDWFQNLVWFHFRFFSWPTIITMNGCKRLGKSTLWFNFLADPKAIEILKCTSVEDSKWAYERMYDETERVFVSLKCNERFLW
jgi:hypothetical protein